MLQKSSCGENLDKKYKAAAKLISNHKLQNNCSLKKCISKHKCSLKLLPQKCIAKHNCSLKLLPQKMHFKT